MKSVAYYDTPPASLSRHAEATRQAILDAAADLLRRREGMEFSMQEVADRAGVTHRTLYRYFPARHVLMNEAAGQFIPGLVASPYLQPASLNEWVGAIADHLALVEANLDIVRTVLGAVLLSDETGEDDGQMSERHSHLWELFRDEFPNLNDDDARKTFALLRQLSSSTTYVAFRRRFGLSPVAATETIQTNARKVLEETARRDRAPGGERSR